LAELFAGGELLKAAQVRLSAIATVLIRCLKYLAKKVGDNAIGLLVKATLQALATLLGIHL